MGYSIENEGIRFYVEDTGYGIPKKLQSQVFGRFQKLNEFAQGTGLGLAISKAIIEAAGGKIGFTSEPGIGSTFWSWIPCEISANLTVRFRLSHLQPMLLILTVPAPSKPGATDSWLNP